MALALKLLSENTSTEQMLIRLETVWKSMYAMQMSLGTLYAGKVFKSKKRNVVYTPKTCFEFFCRIPVRKCFAQLHCNCILSNSAKA